MICFWRFYYIEFVYQSGEHDFNNDALTFLQYPVDCAIIFLEGIMRYLIRALLVLSFIAILTSCGSTRFAFDRTERSIIELGGTYDKTTEENIKKLYDAEGLNAIILEVYRGTYTTIDVEGYLGYDVYKEYQKLEKEMLEEIVTMRNDEGLDEVVNAVLDATYPENMVIAAFGGEGTQLVADFKKAYEEKKGTKDELTLILQEMGYAGIKDALVNGEYDEETIEEYLGKSTLEKAQEIYAKETGTDSFNPTKNSESPLLLNLDDLSENERKKIQLSGYADSLNSIIWETLKSNRYEIGPNCFAYYLPEEDILYLNVVVLYPETMVIDSTYYSQKQADEYLNSIFHVLENITDDTTENWKLSIRILYERYSSGKWKSMTVAEKTYTFSNTDSRWIEVTSVSENTDTTTVMN